MTKNIWTNLVVLSAIVRLCWGTLGELPTAAMDGAAQAVELTVTMAGAYMLWMGLLEIGHQSGLNDKMARGLGKILGPLFPGVRRDKEAMAPSA